MKTLKSLCIVIFTLLFAGCSAHKTQDSTDGKMLLNDIWALTKIKTTDVVKVTGQPQPMIELHLKEGKFLGNTGCNEMQGTLEYGDSFIKFSNFTQTKMFCSESVEIEFVSALLSADSWKIDKLTLYLKKGNDVVLTFKKVD